MELIRIKNGFLLIETPQVPEGWVFCKNKSELHAEIEFFVSEPDLPTPPKPEQVAINERAEGIRQFSDED